MTTKKNFKVSMLFTFFAISNVTASSNTNVDGDGNVVGRHITGGVTINHNKYGASGRERERERERGHGPRYNSTYTVTGDGNTVGEVINGPISHTFNKR